MTRIANRQCKYCGLTKPITEFVKGRRSKDGYKHRCKACARDWDHAYRSQNPRVYERTKAVWRHSHPEKVRAHQMVQYWIRRGVLVRPKSCEGCGKDKPHAHHEDYSQPLAVRWLCALCHKERHVELEAAA